MSRSPALLSLAMQRKPELMDRPIISREEYRANFSDWNDLGIDLSSARSIALAEASGEKNEYPGLSFGLSTGTLGEPGVFITSARDRARWLGTFFSRVLPTPLMLGSSVAVLLRHDSQLYHQVRGRTVFLALSRGADAIAKVLVDLQPEILVGPPSAIRRIVETEIFRRRPWAARLVIAGGEPLWPDDKAVLKESLKAPVRQVYQAAEGFFGASCCNDRIHLNTDIVRIEKMYIKGTIGRFIPVVTDLVRDGAQRIVRYCTEDIALEAQGTCPCRSALPSITSIEGRLADVLVLPSGDLLFPSDIYAAVSAELDRSPFRVTQVSADSLVVELPAGTSAVSSRRVLECLRSLSGSMCPMTLKVDVQDLVFGDLSEKFRRVVRRFKPGCNFSNTFVQEPMSFVSSSRKISSGL